MNRHVALLAFVSVVLSGCDPCENTVYASVPSPDGKWVVHLFDRGCGATVGFLTQASLLPAGEALPAEPGNIVSADGREVLRAEWTSARELVIYTAPDGENAYTAAEHDGIAIVYRPSPSDDPASGRP